MFVSSGWDSDITIDASGNRMGVCVAPLVNHPRCLRWLFLGHKIWAACFHGTIVGMEGDGRGLVGIRWLISNSTTGDGQRSAASTTWLKTKIKRMPAHAVSRYGNVVFVARVSESAELCWWRGRCRDARLVYH